MSADPIRVATSAPVTLNVKNLTLRMQNRRFTRPTECVLQRNFENHIASLAIHYMHYNFVRIHQTLRMTPAMAAGVTAHLVGC